MSTPPDKVPVSKTAATKLDVFLEKFGTDPMAPFGNEGHTPRTLDSAKMQTFEPEERCKNLNALLASSPELKAKMQIAFEQGLIEKIEYLPSKTYAGGIYERSRKSLQLPLQVLDNSPMERGRAAELVFTMGHEVKHAINSPGNHESIRNAFAQAAKIATSPESVHDYTPVAAEIIRIERINEASANIAGFNAIVSKLRKEKPESAPSLAQLYNELPHRMGDFIDRSGAAPKFEYRLKSGLTPEKDMMLTYSGDNIEASGRYYFDKPASEASLGKYGNQDYRHYYCDFVFGHIDKIEKPAGHSKSEALTVEVNLQKLGLQRALLTTNLVFFDNSEIRGTPAIASDESGRASKKTKLDAPKDPPPAIGGAKEPPALYAQSLRAIDLVGAGKLGLHGETETGNVAAAMALQASKLGMRSIDGAFANQQGKLIACEGDMKMDSSKRLVLDVQQAKTQPDRESLAELAKVLQKTEPVVQQNKPPPQR